MPVCSYVVVPRKGRATETARSLSAIRGCEVHAADNADLILLVTTTDSFDEDLELRASLGDVEDIQALLLTFGEIDPETPVGDPVGAARR